MLLIDSFLLSYILFFSFFRIRFNSRLTCLFSYMALLVFCQNSISSLGDIDYTCMNKCVLQHAAK